MGRLATDLPEVVAAAGGATAPASATAQLRARLLDELRRGRAELAKGRSGYDAPVLVAVTAADDGLLAVAPVDAAWRADPEVAGDRAWAMVASLVGAMVDCADGDASRLSLRAGALEDFLALHVPAAGADAETAELTALAFDDRVRRVDRLRAEAVAMPPAPLAAADLRDPVNAGHPLRVAEAVARLGGDPGDPGAADDLDEALAVLLGDTASHSRPHEDPDPAQRIARRILQRLNGMGKWGGYHTEFTHLPRGFAGNDRALAVGVGEALLAAGLLAEKPSVGQRHVYLNPRRAGDIHRFIETGALPPGLTLPFK